ncbi:MAG: 3-deoxy-8-phosphooctulonate synthase [Chlamydiae bacterium GWF2_49_8]|nr:MAG: 3-deoxy-8-phosphooctulonate synthase [Chlamydiae bacterium GWF2_49_8]
MQKVKIKDFFVGDDEHLTLFSGPCVMESKEHTLACASRLKEICAPLGINLVFKASYDKANRSSIASFRGPGLEKGLNILQEVKERLSLPVVTDVHSPEEARRSGEVCDVLQIPAFLCRQTDLIVAAARTSCVIKVKKGQFMAPWDMKNVVRKILSAGNDQIILTERGTSFGYNNLVSDPRSIPIMQSLGFPVCFDASHSIQLPGGRGETSGGERAFIPTLTRAALAAGCDCLFIESHPDPQAALSDKDSVMDFNDLKELLFFAKELYRMVRTCFKEPACMEK